MLGVEREAATDLALSGLPVDGSGQDGLHGDLEGPPSSVPLSADQRQIQMAIVAVRELQRARILRLIGRLLSWVAGPTLLLAWLWRPGFAAPIVIGAAGLGLAILGGLGSRLPLHLRCWITSAGLWSITVGCFLQFGPVLSAGLVFVAGQLASGILLGRNGGLITAGLLGAVVTGVTSYQSAHASEASGVVQTDWLVLTVSSLVGLVGVGVIFDRMQAEQWRAFEKEVTLRVRERRLVADREKVLHRAANFQRLESLGRLAGGIAHDFNNSLVVVQCGIDSLEDSNLPPPERDEILHELGQAVERAGATARQLLAFAKRNVEEIGQCRPEDVLQRLRAESHRLVPKHIVLTFLIEPCPGVSIAEAAFEQMVLNLIQNARDALGERSGHVVVQLSTKANTGGMDLSVSDDGPGMTPEVADQAFEPFFTTKGDHSAGLGLSTVWGIARRNGGDVSMETHLARGTTVRVALPGLSEMSTVPSSLTSVITLSAQGQSLSVLLLEDEAPVRVAVRRILQNMGFVVSEAGTVDEARSLLQTRDFGLLISDGVVPNGGVGTFIQEFSAKFRRAPVILCSGYLEEDLALRGVASGKCAFLAKPFTAQELNEVIMRVLSARPRSPHAEA
jgi:signal transduction histidine kinase/ActR/RegA family two-component response regulator